VQFQEHASSANGSPAFSSVLVLVMCFCVSSPDSEPPLPEYSSQREGNAHILYLYGEEQ